MYNTLLKRIIFAILCILPAIAFTATIEQWEVDFLEERLQKDWFETNCDPAIKEAIKLYPRDKEKQHQYCKKTYEDWVEEAMDLSIANVVKERLKEERKK